VILSNLFVKVTAVMLLTVQDGDDRWPLPVCQVPVWMRQLFRICWVPVHCKSPGRCPHCLVFLSFSHNSVLVFDTLCCHLTTAPRPFYGPFSKTIRVRRCQKRTSGLLWCKGRLTAADTQTIRLGATLSLLTSAHLHHPHFLEARCPSCRPTNSVKALKATSTFGLGRRR